MENVEIISNGKSLCKNQHLEIEGLYGIVGLYNTLRSSFISLLTGSIPHDVEKLRFCGDILYGDQLMNYSEFQQMMNPFTMFYSTENVRSSLEFVNLSEARRLMDIFDLMRIENVPISSLSVCESRAWEAAVGVASNAKMVVLRDLQIGHEVKKRFLSFLKEYANENGCVILIELDSPLEYELNGCIVVRKSGFECIDLSGQEGFHSYQRILSRNILRECGIHSDQVKDTTTNQIERKSGVGIKNGGEGGRRIHQKESFEFNHDVLDDRVFYRIKKEPIPVVEKARFRSMPLNDNDSGILKRLFTLRLYSVDLKVSLVLVRRKHIFEEKKRKEFGKIIVSFLIQMYLAVIFRIKTSMFTGILTTSGILIRGIFKTGVVVITDSISRRSTEIESDVFRIISSIPRYVLSPIVSVVLKTKEILISIRSYNCDLMDYKIISTGIYFLLFMRGGTIINEERAQIYNYINKVYSPGTYFFYIFIYLIMTTWVPVLLLSFLLNTNFSLIFLSTGTFICSLLNLTSRLRFKYVCMCVILAFNLLYPLNSEKFHKGFFFRYFESFNLLVVCREFPFISSEQWMSSMYRLLRGFLLIYLFFCYKLSKF